MEIIDFHLHMMTAGLRRRWMERLASQPDLQRAAQRNTEKKLAMGGATAVVLPESPEQAAQWWLEHLDKNGVAIGAFMCGVAENEEFNRFLSMSPRFVGITWLNAADTEAPAILEREVAAGMRMVKLYPPAQHFHLNDRACYPFYETCARLNVPILIHMGITMGYYADLTYANPLDLHVPARDFPEVTFTIAHFGAGFLRECLMLAYQVENLCFDSSGSNSWLKYQDVPLTLE
ncbi:MAG: amidohydrolase family protein, partial [Candidatus Xenobia bacterium]